MNQPWLYIVLLGGVIIVVGMMMPRKTKEPDSQGTDSMHGMEAALEQFMENMEEENRQMVELIAKSRKDAQTNAKAYDERIKQLEIRCAELERQMGKHALSAAPIPSSYITDKLTYAEHAALHQTPPLATEPVVSFEPEEPEEDTSIRGRYPELFDLYQSGKSIESISKKLGMNKGEVQLILQLSKQEEVAPHE
ncbi:hypothetical protein ACFFSY_27630 [Paenibacillus aurantiacus]|uniref:DUF2802 domain-containing protein n=1 Tax=Paenibacillus aurantiacus TaxID=1936118 RepID=A0ABV5KWX2_9BACL